MLHGTIFNATLHAINNNVIISANNMADDESNQRRKVKFLQILLLMDSLEEEDVLRSRERVIWTRSWIRRREERGAYHQLIRELAVEDAPAFARYFRMDKEKFNDFSMLLQARLMCSSNQSAPLGLLKRFLFVLSLLSSTILGTSMARVLHEPTSTTFGQQCCSNLNRLQIAATCCRNRMLR